MRPKKTWFVRAALMAAAGGCFTGGGGGSGAGGVSVTVLGTVVDEAGAPVAGAIVGDDTATATTGANGSFQVDLVAPGDRLIVKVDAAGFAPGRAVVRIKDQVDRYRIPIRVTKLSTASIDPAKGGKATIEAMGRTITVALKPGAVSGSGQVTVRGAGIDPRFGPGLETATGYLQSAGMFYIDAVDEDGAPLDLVMSGGLEFQMPAFQMPDVPGAEPLNAWKLDDQAQWGSPMDVGAPEDAPVLPADAFGYWNADRAYKTACVKGKLKSNSGACKGQHVRADGVDGLSSSDNAGKDGSFCVVGAVTLTSTLVIGSSSVQAPMPAQAGDCSAPQNCADLGDVEVPDSACDDPQGGGGGAGGGMPCAGFTCPSGDCVDPSKVCNQAFDCPGGEDEDPNICGNQDSCCVATAGCPGETGSDCADSCCCCPGGQACCADPTQGCCASP